MGFQVCSMKYLYFLCLKLCSFMYLLQRIIIKSYFLKTTFCTQLQSEDLKLSTKVYWARRRSLQKKVPPDKKKTLPLRNRGAKKKNSQFGAFYFLRSLRESTDRSGWPLGGGGVLSSTPSMASQLNQAIHENTTQNRGFTRKPGELLLRNLFRTFRDRSCQL